MAQPSPAPPDRSVRLLVVDDNHENRDLLARRLRRLGYSEIDMAEDGQDAIELIMQEAPGAAPFDAVLLDVMMPRMNGVQVLERMAAEALLTRTPVIMISAGTEIETVVRCIELGAEDYLPKPFNPVLLRARLGAVLEKKRLQDALARQLVRFETELAEARRQQLSMVPNTFPDAGRGSPVDVHAVLYPAREVGGDLYDCFDTVPGILCIAVGDVSDKGVPAALFMARTRSLLRASALQHAAATGAAPEPAQLAAVLNDELCKNNPTGMFVTLFVGFLEVGSGRLTFVNAGHPRPLRLFPGQPATEVVTHPSPPLGLRPGLAFTSHTILLAPGEGLVIISDGLPDMLGPDGSFYSLPRVVADLDGLAAATPREITATLAANVQAFAAGTPAADDVTVLALRRC